MTSQRSPSTVSRQAGSTTSIGASSGRSFRKLSKVFGHGLHWTARPPDSDVNRIEAASAVAVGRRVLPATQRRATIDRPGHVIDRAPTDSVVTSKLPIT
jgi:hypothetical protein